MASKDHSVINIPKGCSVIHRKFGGRVWTVVRVPWPKRAVGPLDKSALACIDEENNIILWRTGPNAIISLIHEISHWAYPSLEDDPVVCPKCQYNFGIQNDLARGDSLMTEAIIALGGVLDGMLEGYE